MENQFTFIQSPEITALGHALELMPGLKRVDLIKYDPISGELHILRKQEGENEVAALQASKQQIKSTLEFVRKQKLLAWYQNADMPYLEESNKKLNSDLFSEIENSLLFIPMRSFSGVPDLFFVFFFRKNASELGPVSQQSVLDTSHKQMLGRLISNSLKAILNSVTSNRKVMLEYNEMIKKMMIAKELEIKRKSEFSKRYQAYLDAVLEDILNQLKNNDEEILIPDHVKNKLYPHLSNQSYLETLLKNALNFARTFHFLQSESQIELLEEYFEPIKSIQIEPDNKVEPQQDLYSSHTKTYQFLQSLEEAAIRIIQKGEKLTSSNVGQELIQPVTAAAISDKLKNHSYKINLLLAQFPSKWPLIRNQFRPVINIVEKSSEQKYAS